MAWRDLVAGLAEQTDAVFGEPVFYTCAGHAAVPVTAPFELAYQDVKIEDGLTITATRPMVHVRISTLPAAPFEGDTFVVRGVSYTVMESRFQDDNTAMCFAVQTLEGAA